MLAGIHAFLYWSGLAACEAGGARILVVHGTPRRRAAELERQFAYLRRACRVVPLAELVGRLEMGSRVDRLVALTFDDGLRSHVEVAYPLLERYRLPATFFLCPQLVDRGAWLWTHAARLRFAWLEPGEQDALARRLRAPRDVEAFIEWMKRLALPARVAVEKALRVMTPYFAVGWEEHEACDLAGWDALRRLDPALVAFGSHTLSHPMLRSLEAAELETEIRDSRRLLEERLGRAIDFFAYPDGEHDARAREQVRAHYRAALLCARQAVVPGADLHLLPRLGLPRGALRLARRLHQHQPRMMMSGAA